MSPLEIKEISAPAELKRLRPRWRDLLESSIRPTVFAGWEWQFQCAGLLTDKNSLYILAVFDEDKLIGILPLQRTKMKLGGILSADVLACLGGGITDYNALVIRRRCLSTVIPALSEHLAKTGRVLNLENVLPGTPLDIFARYLTQNGYSDAVYESKTALVSDLDTDYGIFIKRLKQKFRRNLNNNRNRMNRDGDYSFHTEPAGDEQLAELIRLHTARWQHKGESGVLARRRIQSFHAGLQAIDDCPFEIRYYTIRHRGKIIAVVYGYLFHGCFYAYLSGLDMAHNRISPGNMVFDYCVRELIKHRIRRFDMLRGDMKYKQSWATRALQMKDRLVFPPTLSGRLRYALMKTSLTLRRLLPASWKKSLKKILHHSPVTNNDAGSPDKGRD